MSQSAYPFTETSTSKWYGDTTTINPFVSLHEYRRYHGYVSCIVCIFGLSANIINFIVLTRKQMIKSVNCILAALATVDFLTMLPYLIYVVYFYIVKQPKLEDNHSYAWMCFLLIHNQFTQMCHNMSLWFTVYLSWLRFNFVCTNGSQVFSLKKTLITIFMIALIIVILTIPNFFMYKVVSLEELGLTGVHGFWIVDSNFMVENHIYKTFIFWIYVVAIKIVPCTLLTFFIGRIIFTMFWASKRSKHLQELPMVTSRIRAQNRTTIMLVAVISICLVTEMPQGILAMIGAINEDFFKNVYSNIYDILDVLVLLNSSVNFILYCLMSRQFRDTFKNVFFLRERETQIYELTTLS